jgi:predicted phage baseplate assembly protein
MPLPLANLNLDDRRWADLVEEGRALIPRYAPGWSDHNLSDPGVTLIELFAWLTDQSLYNLNQVPEQHRRKFLGLIGYPPRPPQPAQAVLAIRSWDLPPTAIPSGFELEADDTKGRSVAFRTLRDLTAAPVELAAMRVDIGDGTPIDRTRDWSEGLPVAVVGNEPRPGAALYLGFKVSEYVGLTPAEIPISLAFHFEGPETGPDGPTRLIEESR